MCNDSTWIWVALVLVSNAAALAQQSSQGHINLKVTDPSGSFVPYALVQVRNADSKIESETLTDARGEAVLYLDPDAATISVRSSGFEVWRFKIGGREDVAVSLNAILRIESFSGPTVVNADQDLKTEPQPPIDAAIPMQPLESLIGLPVHKLRRHARTHHTVD